mmetsp:Transcript_12989/g.30538  ORF Transcript_12989/g.30538 Transcript_12989/m.30538 type:complete len:140 (-) Transcript_12989:169-588(-)
MGGNGSKPGAAVAVADDQQAIISQTKMLEAHMRAELEKERQALTEAFVAQQQELASQQVINQLTLEKRESANLETQIAALKAQQYTPKNPAAKCVDEEGACLKCYEDAAKSGKGVEAFLECRAVVEAYSSCAKASTGIP